MMRVLALDPATSTGYAVCEMDATTKKTKLVSWGIIKVNTTSEFEGDWMNDLSRKIDARLLDPKPDLVFVENYFFSQKKCSGAPVNVYFRAAIYALMRTRNIPYRILNPTFWKTFITGVPSGKPSKERIKRDGKAAANKTIVYEALKERFNTSFPDYIKVEGKRVKFKYDISDAVGIAYCGIHGVEPGAVLWQESDAPVSSIETQLRIDD
jgi:Holliday junction resolvasome RuvABC endonuclease subunit